MAIITLCLFNTLRLFLDRSYYFIVAILHRGYYSCGYYYRAIIHMNIITLATILLWLLCYGHNYYGYYSCGYSVIAIISLAIMPWPILLWLLCLGHYYCGYFSCGHYAMDTMTVAIIRMHGVSTLYLVMVYH